MFHVFLSLVLFVCAVAVHIFYCRRASKARLHAKAFIIIALCFLGVYILAVQYWPVGLSVPLSLWVAPFKITSAVIFLLLVPAYLTFYTLTQLMSPSKKILICVSRKGVATYEEIVEAIDEEDFIGTRLHDLVASGCVTHRDGCYVLSGSGQRIADILKTMQFILGRDMGG